MMTTTTGKSLNSPIRSVVNGEMRNLKRVDSPAPPQPSDSGTQPTLPARDAPSAIQLSPPGSATTRSLAASAAVSLLDLAAELGTQTECLYPLLGTDYLRLVRDSPIHEHVLVQRPPEHAMHWLRSMFAPIYLRPMLELEQAAATMQVSVNELRTLALDHNIQLYMDPGFGELISVVGFHRLHRALVRSRRPMRYDRQAMMGILALIRGIEIPTAEKGFTLPYHERLEVEIRRICRLPEPERTDRACAFYSAYMDAKTMADCLEKYHAATHPKPGKEAMLDQRVMNMARRYGGELAVIDGEAKQDGPEP